MPPVTAPPPLDLRCWLPCIGLCASPVHCSCRVHVAVCCISAQHSLLHACAVCLGQRRISSMGCVGCTN
jgi:hypothetical protein